MSVRHDGHTDPSRNCKLAERDPSVDNDKPELRITCNPKGNTIAYSEFKQFCGNVVAKALLSLECLR